MNTIAITGASGFVGKNLIAYLQNKTVVPINRTQIQEPLSELLHDCDAVVHLAGKAHDLKNVSNPDEYYEVNFELTKKIFDSFINSKAKKFLFVSSVKAVADSVDGQLDERAAPAPQTHYGKSKLLAEQYIQSQTLPEGKYCYILRPCMIHGPGNKGNLNLLYKFVQKGIPYPLAAFNNKRSFLSVENFCFVIANIIEKDIPSGIYQVADDEALSTNDVVSILGQSMGRKPKLWAIPSKLVKILAKLGDVLKLPLSTERLDKLTESYVVSNLKIKDALEVKFPLGSREGLAITAKSFNEAINISV